MEALGSACAFGVFRFDVFRSLLATVGFGSSSRAGREAACAAEFSRSTFVVVGFAVLLVFRSRCVMMSPRRVSAAHCTTQRLGRRRKLHRLFDPPVIWAARA